MEHLAITFTNKAVVKCVKSYKIVDEAEDVWVSTFHSTCIRILRRYIDTIGYERNFTIYDTDDQEPCVTFANILILIQKDLKKGQFFLKSPRLRMS